MREHIQQVVLRKLALQAGAEQSSENLSEKIRRFILRIHSYDAYFRELEHQLRLHSILIDRFIIRRFTTCQ